MRVKPGRCHMEAARSNLRMLTKDENWIQSSWPWQVRLREREEGWQM